MNSELYTKHIQQVLDNALAMAKRNTDGAIANYIPELANVDEERLVASILFSDGGHAISGEDPKFQFTLQSVSKVVLLIGLLEEFGVNKVFEWINAEPSGESFAAISDLEEAGNVPSNPLVNAGAIALSSHIPGNAAEKVEWIDHWMTRCYGTRLTLNQAVLQSEIATGFRNRSLANMMRSTGAIDADPDAVLNLYYRTCSYEVDILQASFLPMLLANGGLKPNGTRIISEATCKVVTAIMATCGMYNESGTYLVHTGMPAKSGVSGLIIAVATGRGGVAVYSPRLNDKGGSIRGHIMLREISKQLDWHFAAPWGYARLDSTLHNQDNA